LKEKGDKIFHERALGDEQLAPTLSRGIILIEANKITNWVLDFCIKLDLEIDANHMLVSEIESPIRGRKMHMNL
jgi:hypothetical protein